MKKLIIVLLALIMLLTAASCGAKKILHCDNCNREVTVDESSNMEEDWIIYCEPCNELLFGDDSLLGG